MTEAEGESRPDVTLRTFATDAEAHQVVDEHLAALTRRVESIKAQRSQALQAIASATSRDGHVRVTVDATGVPTELTLSLTAFEDTTPEKLARTVLATAQQAAASVRASVRGAVDGIRDSDPDISVARQGAQRLLGDLSLPEVPRTVSDPPGVRDPWAEDTRAPAAADPDAPFDEGIADLDGLPRDGG